METAIGILWAVLLWVGLMSGVLSILREIADLFYPGSVPGKDLFWACTRTAAIIAPLALWQKERRLRKSAEHPVESPDSLRRRTKKIADEVETFLRDRFLAQTRIVSFGEQADYSRLVSAHQSETFNIYKVNYHSRLSGVTNELRAKGVSTRSFGYNFGEAGQLPTVEDMDMLRSIACLLDHKDDAIRI